MDPDLRLTQAMLTTADTTAMHATTPCASVVTAWVAILTAPPASAPTAPSLPALSEPLAPQSGNGDTLGVGADDTTTGCTNLAVVWSRRVSNTTTGCTNLAVGFPMFDQTLRTTQDNRIDDSSYRQKRKARFPYSAVAASFDFSELVPHTCRTNSALLSRVAPADGRPCTDISEVILEQVGQLAVETNMTQRISWRILHATRTSSCRRKLKEYQIPKDEAKLAITPSGFDILTVIDPSKVDVEGFANYFRRTWLDMLPPTYWNADGMRRDIASRANNRLERFHLHLNGKIKVRHPSMTSFVDTLEGISCEYVAQRIAVLSGLAWPPQRQRVQLPRNPQLPRVADIMESEESDGEDERPVIVTADGPESCSSALSSGGDAAEMNHDREGFEPDHSLDYDGDASAVKDEEEIGAQTSSEGQDESHLPPPTDQIPLHE
ncbi:hypothetical protein ON010_g3638 [Phytophthora cinnamomi]|nr:hypothetical protein ON010_g3638 [Phytophthora cinnamomi]